MQRTDLDTPLLTISSPAEKNSSRFIRITCSGILVITCTIFGFTQTYAQDVAAAARQEQARKQDQQKKPKHVYTDEDLKRVQILTPEDRAEVEAKKKQQPLPGAKPQESFDAEALPADLPLGDVARRYRRMRELIQLEQSAEFHLPFTDEPVLAAPKPSAPIAPESHLPTASKHPVAPVHPVISIPTAPRIEPYHPPVKRSPFERPHTFSPASPAAPSHSSANHAIPPQPPALSATPVPHSTISVAPSNPSAPAPRRMEMPAPRLTPHATPAEPAAPAVHTVPSHRSILSGAPSKPSAPAPDLRMMPAPKPAPRVTVEDPSAPVVHATPSHSSLLPASPAKPIAPMPDFSVMPSPRLAPHATPKSPSVPVLRVTPPQPSSVLVAPAQPPAPVAELKPVLPPVAVVAPAKPVTAVFPAASAKLNLLIVKPGDSLWKIAQENLGKGVRWPELLAVNPGIVDGNHIMAGSQINLPVGDASTHAASAVVVQKGDTLSRIAQARFGHASLWSCIAEANPGIRNANVIFEGQRLLVPDGCKR